MTGSKIGYCHITVGLTDKGVLSCHVRINPIESGERCEVHQNLFERTSVVEGHPNMQIFYSVLDPDS